MSMKKLECVIRPHFVEPVKKALEQIGVQGMTVLEAKGFGRQKGHKEIYRGVEYQVDFVPKALLIIVLPEDRVETTIEAVVKVARTGEFGDGKIFVSEVSDVIRIRTGERGAEAL